MKKAWEILKTRMSSKAKKFTDKIMVDGRERSAKEIITLMYKLISKDSNTSGRDTIPTSTELRTYLSKNREYVSRIVKSKGKRTTYYERVI